MATAAQPAPVSITAALKLVCRVHFEHCCCLLRCHPDADPFSSPANAPGVDDADEFFFAVSAVVPGIDELFQCFCAMSLSLAPDRGSHSLVEVSGAK